MSVCKREKNCLCGREVEICATVAFENHKVEQKKKTATTLTHTQTIFDEPLIFPCILMTVAKYYKHICMYFHFLFRTHFNSGSKFLINRLVFSLSFSLFVNAELINLNILATSSWFFFDSLIDDRLAFYFIRLNSSFDAIARICVCVSNQYQMTRWRLLMWQWFTTNRLVLFFEYNWTSSSSFLFNSLVFFFGTARTIAAKLDLWRK